MKIAFQEIYKLLCFYMLNLIHQWFFQFEIASGLI
jgi:hypothetical protein